MSIEFETPKPITQQQYVLKTVADNMMRPHSRYFDENEHEIPWDYITFMHQAMKASGAGSLAPKDEKKADPNKPKRPPIGYQLLAHMLEIISWGDVGMYLVTPGGGLGAAAVQAAGSPEQKKKFLARFLDDKPTFAAMCMTEADAGSPVKSNSYYPLGALYLVDNTCREAYGFEASGYEPMLCPPPVEPTAEPGESTVTCSNPIQYEDANSCSAAGCAWKETYSESTGYTIEYCAMP